MNDQFKSLVDQFTNENIQHKYDIELLMDYCGELLRYRSFNHDNDKLCFEGDLKDWKQYFKKGHHFKGIYGNTHHHKEDVMSFFGVIEMLCDWVCASYRRDGLLNPEDYRNGLPEIDWNSILVETLKQIISIWTVAINPEIIHLVSERPEEMSIKLSELVTR